MITMTDSHFIDKLENNLYRTAYSHRYKQYVRIVRVLYDKINDEYVVQAGVKCNMSCEHIIDFDLNDLDNFVL